MHREKSSVHHTPAIPACSDGFVGKAVCKLCVLVHLQLPCPQMPSLPCSAPGRAVVPNNHITWAASCSTPCCDQAVRTTQEPTVGEKLGCFFSVHPHSGPALMTMWPPSLGPQPHLQCPLLRRPRGGWLRLWLVSGEFSLWFCPHLLSSLCR